MMNDLIKLYQEGKDNEINKIMEEGIPNDDYTMQMEIEKEEKEENGSWIYELINNGTQGKYIREREISIKDTEKVKRDSQELIEKYKWIDTPPENTDDEEGLGTESGEGTEENEVTVTEESEEEYETEEDEEVEEHKLRS